MKKRVLLFFSLICMFSAVAKGGRPYKGHIELSLGEAYNLNTAQLVSNNNMQLYGMLSTTHGVLFKEWYVGGGIGYYFSFCDKESAYPTFVVCRFVFRNAKVTPYVESRVGMVYDPRWVQRVQIYGSLGGGMNINKRLQGGLRLSAYSRPSRFFTANVAIAFSYSIFD